jgi:hypothetical protein
MENEVLDRLNGALFNPEHLLKLQGRGHFLRMGDHKHIWQCYLGAPAEALFMTHDFDGEFDGDFNVMYIIAPHPDLAGGLHLEAHVYENFGPGTATFAASISAQGEVVGWQYAGE